MTGETMDIEERIRELKRELEMLEAQRAAQPQDPSQYSWFSENPLAQKAAPSPYIQKMPYTAPPAGTGGPVFENMPYRANPTRKNQNIKKL